MILPSTSHELRVRLGSVPSAQLPVVVSYADLTASTFVGGGSFSETDSTTPVTVLAAPAASTVRQIKSITVVNVANADVMLEVYVYDGVDEYIVYGGPLYPTYTLNYSPEQGWHTAPPFSPVNSVNGQSGDVVLDTDDVGEGSANLYFTDERAQDAVGAALTDTAEIDFTYDDGANEISAQLNANAVAWSKLNQTAGYSVLGKQSTGTGDVTYMTASADNQLLMRTSNVLGFKAWDNALIPDASLPYGKLVDASGYTVIAKTTSGTGPINGVAATANGQYLLRRSNALVFAAPAASEIVNTPAGNIAANDVQSALNELDTEKVAKAGDAMTGELAISVDQTYQLTLTRVNDGNLGPLFRFFHDSSSPATNDVVGGFQFFARDNVGSQVFCSQLSGRLITPTAGNITGEFFVSTVLNNTNAARLMIRAGLFMSGAAGGDQGVGTINATAVYDDGVLLTCAPLREEMNLAGWNAIAPNVAKEDGGVEVRTHRTAKRHFDMLAEGFNPSDPEQYVARLDRDKALPGLMTLEEWQERMPLNEDGTLADGADKPTIGEATTRQMLAMDYLALAFKGLVGRVKALEAENNRLKSKA